jgi:hypothetical protein
MLRHLQPKTLARLQQPAITRSVRKAIFPAVRNCLANRGDSFQLMRYNNYAVAFWAAVLAGMFVGALQQSEWRGDSTEYLLYAHAYVAHLSPEFRREDIAGVLGTMEKGDPDFLNIAPSIGKGREFGRKAQLDGKGYVTTSNGQVYSWHFWLYPLFVAPFFQFTQWIGVPFIDAFIFCNWVFMLLALGYLTWSWKGTSFQKHILAGLFLLTGTTYYVWWPHPEVFTASLLLLALMTASDRRYGWSMLSTALAAAQNPPLIILLAALAVRVVIDKDIICVEQGSIKIQIGAHYRTLLMIIAAFAISLAPVVFFQLALGVSNPIVAAGGADAGLISWSRLFSLFADLNQGMVVATPGIFLGVVVLMLTALWYGNRLGGAAWLSPVWVGMLISVTMAVPALATTNWNPGQAVFTRYAYWLSVPITFGFVVSLGALPRRWRIMLGLAVVITQLMTVGYYGLWGKNWRSNQLVLKPVAKYVLLNYPWLYNPVPQIFIARLPHGEDAADVDNEGRLVYRYPDKGMPTKILLHQSQVEEVQKILKRDCNSVSVVPAEGNWVYLNVRGSAGCMEAKQRGRESFSGAEVPGN